MPIPDNPFLFPDIFNEKHFLFFVEIHLYKIKKYLSTSDLSTRYICTLHPKVLLTPNFFSKISLHTRNNFEDFKLTLNQ